MSVFKVMLMTIAVVLLGMATANAQPNKPNKQTTRHAKATSCDPVQRLAEIMINEGNPNLVGWVSVGHAVLVRTAEHGGNICKATATGFAPRTKKPTAEVKTLAATMWNDYLNGFPTVKVELQARLEGCAYFYNPVLVKQMGYKQPVWGKTFKNCGDNIEDHNFRRDPKSKVVAYRNWSGKQLLADNRKQKQLVAQNDNRKPRDSVADNRNMIASN